MKSLHVPSFIQSKRDGRDHSTHDLHQFIAGITDGSIPDYQASAWAMAVFFKGMVFSEMVALTDAMMHSGDIFSFPAGAPPRVDKHSTGGVGDKTSLVIAPLLACDDLWVPMISGRGLGITGGTLDKLESIPGFQTGLPMDVALRQIEKIGVAMIGQTARLCPADRKLYALRDVTATVESIPLIVASIMSKKLAENLNRLVLDVKFGSGAFMKTEVDARTLAENLSAVGAGMGVHVAHRLTPMDEPLGRAMGNALEVAEAVEILKGGGPQDTVDLILDLCEPVANSSRDTLQGWLRDGTAWEKFVQMVEAQGGKATALDNICEIHCAPVQHQIFAPREGVLERVDAGLIGQACVLLGAGRARATDAVDFAAGCLQWKKVGSTVAAGELIFELHTSSEERRDLALPLITRALVIR